MAGVSATAVGLECTAFSRAGAGSGAVERVNETRPSVASSVAKASPPMAAQKPIPGTTSKAPVTTNVPPVASANGRSFAPVISTAAQISPTMAKAAEAKCDARWGIKEAISPNTAQASMAMAMGACVFSDDGRRTAGAGASACFCCCSLNSRRVRSAAFSPEGASAVVSVAGAGSSMTASVGATSDAACPTPSTRSIPLMAVGSTSPTRTVKNTRKKQPVTAANANAATHAGSRNAALVCGWLIVWAQFRGGWV